MIIIEEIEAYKKIVRSSKILRRGYFINNLLGFMSFPLFIYLIWWVWDYKIFGIIIFFVFLHVFNNMILITFFRYFNKPQAEKARENALKLLSYGVLDFKMIKDLETITVEYWPAYIINNINSNNLRDEFKKIGL